MTPGDAGLGDAAPRAVPRGAVCRYVGRVEGGGEGTPPAGTRAPFRWPCIAVGRVPVALRFPDASDCTGPTSLRIATAIDIREPAVVAVRMAATREPLGIIDLRFASVLQTGDLPLTPAALWAAGSGGLTLERADSSDPVYLFGPGSTLPAFAPHLLTGGDPDHVRRIISALGCEGAALAQFGWMAACALDAQLDLGLDDALDSYLDRYFDDRGPVWEDFRSRPSDGVVGETESTAMYAGLAARRPEHPALDRLLEFFAERTAADGTIRGGAIVAEHNYSVAYPLALIGRLRDDRRLVDAAVRQLRIRRSALRGAPASGLPMWLRLLPDGTRTYRGWSRGVAWYLLGAARTLRVLADQPGLDDLHDDLADGCLWAIARQRPGGLWGAYLEEPATAVETSGSAGIAAAIAIAAQHGWLSESAIAAARTTLDALAPFVTADGRVGGMSQSNKSEAGEDLQRSDYRIVGGCATGLASQLIAALGRFDSGRSEMSSR